jgi:hypothetical protein
MVDDAKKMGDLSADEAAELIREEYLNCVRDDVFEDSRSTFSAFKLGVALGLLLGGAKHARLMKDKAP